MGELDILLYFYNFEELFIDESDDVFDDNINLVILFFVDEGEEFFV